MARLTPPSVAEVLNNKGKYQYSMLRVESWDELAAAQAAGIDMCSVPPEMMVDPKFRDVAPAMFAVPGMALYNGGTTDDYLRCWLQDDECRRQCPLLRRLFSDRAAHGR